MDVPYGLMGPWIVDDCNHGWIIVLVIVSKLQSMTMMHYEYSTPYKYEYVRAQLYEYSIPDGTAVPALVLTHSLTQVRRPRTRDLGTAVGQHSKTRVFEYSTGTLQ